MKLIFVYNADSGTVNALVDSVHKVLSPSTYNCALCYLTHGVIGERERWKAYRNTTGHQFIFLHRDEFQKQYRSKWLPKFTFPVVLEAGAEGLQLLIGSEELSDMDQPEELMDLINARLPPG